MVVGADGRNSFVAKAVEPPEYHERPPLEAAYYTYWSGLEADAFEIFVRDRRGWGVIPTHDDLTLVVVGWPHAEFRDNRRDVEGSYLGALEQAPAFAERVRGATREAPFRGASVRSFFRTPHGPGWALVGDAGYNKDPITALGISDAFRDAELCARALDEGLSGSRPPDAAMDDYARARDEHALPLFELTCGFATLEPPPAEMLQLLSAAEGNQAAMDGFVSVMAGSLPAPEFFAPANAARIMAQAAA
jgi:2-polyprenyl-6-methoxyphenol hydroxylase-like FAD-dependent oxidoreductase